MSGYPLKSVHDSFKKRKAYEQELALRAKLDDINLQANKLYKRTGAISALPDTRTTTEKLSDLYRLRIDVYDKLKTIMSGDDAQKTINGLSIDEIQFLSQRLDKIVQYFKQKYKLGVPYQVFNDYLSKSIEALNILGDDNVANLALVENMVSKDDFNYALTNMMKQYSTAEQNKLRGTIRFYEGLATEIMRAQDMISRQIIDAQSQNDLTQMINDISKKIPNNDEIDNLLLEYQTAVSYSDTQAINDLKLKIDELVADVTSLQNDKRDLESRINDAIRDNQISQLNYQLNTPQEQQMSPSQTQTIYKTSGPYTYIPPNDVMNKKLWSRTSQTKKDLAGYIDSTYKLLPNKQIWYEKGGKTPHTTMSTNWKVEQVRKWIVDNDDLFKQAWTETVISSIPPVLSTSQQTPVQSGTQTPVRSGTQTQISSGSQTPNILTLTGIANSLGISVKNITDAITSVGDELTSSGIQIPETFVNDVKKSITSLPTTQVYQNSLKTLPEISAYILDWIQNLRTDQNTSLADYIDNRTISGTGLRKIKSKMRGKGILIDYNAGIKADASKQNNYVPFGKFVINRNKLACGIIMMKRPNGAFMGDIKTKRISNNLKNVFDKIVGGNIPSFNDYDKLDDDEREYLKFVSSKANLEDKLAVPAPKKDTDEKLINKFEVYRGQLCAGQDNKEMIEEFKKLLIILCDKKLLPRRQVSDILIDLARYY